MITENYYEENGKYKKRIIELKDLGVDENALNSTNNIKTLPELKARLEKLSQDFIQVQLGAVIEDIEDRKLEFISIQNEIREREGKEPRVYK